MPVYHTDALKALLGKYPPTYEHYAFRSLGGYSAYCYDIPVISINREILICIVNSDGKVVSAYTHNIPYNIFDGKVYEIAGSSGYMEPLQADINKRVAEIIAEEALLEG